MTNINKKRYNGLIQRSYGVFVKNKKMYAACTLLDRPKNPRQKDSKANGLANRWQRIQKLKRRDYRRFERVLFAQRPDLRIAARRAFSKLLKVKAVHKSQQKV